MASELRQLDSFEVRLASGDEGVIEGYAALFNVPVPDFNEVVMPGAFTLSLAEHTRDGSRPAMFWAHNQAEPIGVWDDVREDAKGLAVRGRIVRETARGAEALALLKAGAATGLSLGFRTRGATRGKDGSRELRNLNLVEISIVAAPAANGARITSVRRADPRAAALTALVGSIRQAATALKG